MMVHKRMEMLVAELWYVANYLAVLDFWQNFKNKIFKVKQKTQKLEPLKIFGCL